MIRLIGMIKEFTPNPKEMPQISYGNEKKFSKPMPSLTPGEMNAMVPHEPADHMHPDLLCLECDGMIGPDGMCKACGQPSHDHDVWGKPDEGHQASMAKAELRDMIKNVAELYKTIQPGTELPGWVAAYITLASDYMHSVNEYAQEKSQY